MSQKKKTNELANKLVDSLLQQRVQQHGRGSSKQAKASPVDEIDLAEFDETKSYVAPPTSDSPKYPTAANSGLPTHTLRASQANDEDPFLTSSHEITVPFQSQEKAAAEVQLAHSPADLSEFEVEIVPREQEENDEQENTEVVPDAETQALAGVEPAPSPADPTPAPEASGRKKLDEATRLLTQFRDKLSSAFKAPGGAETGGRGGYPDPNQSRVQTDPNAFEQEVERHRSQAQVRFGQSRVASSRSYQGLGGGGVLPANEATLAQAESLRFAQDRILELEKEIDGLRRENEQLAAAGEAVQRRLDETLAANENLEIRHRENLDDHAEEKKSLRESILNKRLEVERLQSKVDQLEMRLASDLKKIRVRERELENRLELLKMEGAALLRTKDEVILDLKRDVDRLGGEAENFRNKNQELRRHIDGDQDKFRRTVRALRLALSMLESDEEGVVPLKKAE